MNQWQPVWITIAEVALSCRDLVKCGSKQIASQKGAAANLLIFHALNYASANVFKGI